MIGIVVRLALILLIGAGVIRFIPGADVGGASPVLIGAPAEALQAADTMTLRISILVDSSPAIGGVWDGAGVSSMFSGFVWGIPSHKPPDPVLCHFALGRELQCLYRALNGSRTSHCPSSHRCEWVLEIPARGPVALIFIDHDFGVDSANDYIDSLILAESREAASGIEADLRRAIERVSRTSIRLPPNVPRIPGLTQDGDLPLNPVERDRRTAAVPVFGRSACTNSCALQQSAVEIEIVNGGSNR